MLKAYCLPNGRVVQLRQLLPTEKDEICLNVAKVVGKDASAQEFQVQELRDLVRAILYKVTKKDGYPDVQSSMAEGVEWEKLDADKLDEGPYAYDKLFGVVEDEALAGMYRLTHSLTRAQLDDIMGKGLAVSAD